MTVEIFNEKLLDSANCGRTSSTPQPAASNALLTFRLCGATVRTRHTAGVRHPHDEGLFLSVTGRSGVRTDRLHPAISGHENCFPRFCQALYERHTGLERIGAFESTNYLKNILLNALGVCIAITQRSRGNQDIDDRSQFASI